MLEVKNITKVFPGVKALDDVSLKFKPGEIHAIIGENGAGKSTLIKIISGIYQPDKGSLEIDGQGVFLSDYNDAIKHKITIINQEIVVIPQCSVAENIMLDKMEPFIRNGFIQWKNLNQTAKKFLDLVQLKIPPRTPAFRLSSAEKQLVQITKALASDADIFLFDEPTASLTNHEVKILFCLLKDLKSRGKTIIFVSHKLEEVLDICDCLSVLRDGVCIGTRPCRGTSKQDIIQMMIGRQTEDKFFGLLDLKNSDIVLEAKHIHQEGRFQDVSFYLKKGEILGFYGLVGSGRTEIIKLIIGEDRIDSGDVYVNGKKAVINSMADSLEKYKIGYISENRREEGLIVSFTVNTNINITVWKYIRNKFTRLINTQKERANSNEMIERFHIRTTGYRQMVENLSGGNQQKVSIAKWIAANCDILIIDEPTIGVDVGAKEYIHELIWRLAKEEKKSIIVISSDMPELITLARRILVFKDNQIVGEIDGLNDRELGYATVSREIGKYLA